MDKNSKAKFFSETRYKVSQHSKAPVVPFPSNFEMQFILWGRKRDDDGVWLCVRLAHLLTKRDKNQTIGLVYRHIIERGKIYTCGPL